MNFSDESDIELIERYLKNKLTSEERTDFINRMKGDPEFAGKTEDYGLIIHEISKRGARAFQQDLAAWEEEIKREERPQIQITKAQKMDVSASREGNWSKYLSMAAAITITIVGLIFLVDYKKDKKLNELFAAHFSPHDGLLSTHGNGTHVTLAEALESYNSENFPEAVTKFGRYLNENPGDYQAWFYLGVSQLAEGKHADAVASFDVVIEQKVTFRDSAEWYKALALLKANDRKAARTLLKEIASTDGHDYQEKAEALLREL